MAEIRVVQPHQLGVEEAKARLGGFGDLLGKYGVRLDWQGARARFSGVPGVGGQVDVRPDGVDVYVTLSRLITMMGLDPVRLESTIKKRLQEALE
jgi:putative polyhydroxyalkanoate system protein